MTMNARIPTIRLATPFSAIASAVFLFSLMASPVLGQPPAFPPGRGPSPITRDLMARAEAAGVDADELDNFVQQGRALGIPDEPLVRLAEQVIHLGEEGLPYGPVLDRARQGFVKNVPPERIQEVCLRLEDRLRDGAVLVDRSFPEATEPRLRSGPPSQRRIELIDRTAFALEKGVPPEVLAALFRDLRIPDVPPAEQLGRLESPVMAMTSLMTHGVPSDRCLDFVAGAARQGIYDRNLEDLTRAIVGALGGGANRDVLRFVQNQLRNGRPPREIVRDLQQRRDHMRDGNMQGGRPGPGSDVRPPEDPGRRRGRGNGPGGHP